MTPTDKLIWTPPAEARFVSVFEPCNKNGYDPSKPFEPHFHISLRQFDLTTPDGALFRPLKEWLPFQSKSRPVVVFNYRGQLTICPGVRVQSVADQWSSLRSEAALHNISPDRLLVGAPVKVAYEWVTYSIPSTGYHTTGYVPRIRAVDIELSSIQENLNALTDIR